MKILLVEDDERTAFFIKKGLKQAGFVVDHVSDGEDALHRALHEFYDAVIMDIMLPRMDGLTIIDEMRKTKVLTPVIVLSAKNSLNDRIKGLQAGGDDYLVKPFAFSELLARIHALIRRANAVPEPTSLKVEDLSMDIISRKVFRSGSQIELQPREFALLEYLMRNVGKVISKTMIMKHVWNYNFDPQTNIVEVSICRLREKVDRSFDHGLIHTIRGIGYVLGEKKV